jgi:hypothetical protein
MVLESQSNAEMRVRGFIKSGFDHLVDDRGVSIEVKAWNMIKRVHTERIESFSNRGIAESSVQTVRASREVTPIKEWAPAKLGTNEQFSGALSKNFPELARLSDDQVDRILNASRRREIEE